MRIDFSVIGDGEEQRGFDKSSELKLTLNKKDFAPESEIELELRAPFAGSGLITIEREKVYAYKWFKSTSATSVQKIKIPAGVEGYAYVNVFLAAFNGFKTSLHESTQLRCRKFFSQSGFT